MNTYINATTNTQTEQQTSIANQNYQLAFKSASEHVVILSISQHSRNNFNRPGISNENKLNASYRISDATPIRIYNKKTGQDVQFCFSDYDKQFKYEVGVPIHIEMSEPYDVASGAGISVFLSEERAKYEGGFIVNNLQKTFDALGNVISTKVQYIENGQNKLATYKKLDSGEVGYIKEQECRICHEKTFKTYNISGVQMGETSVTHRTNCQMNCEMIHLNKYIIDFIDKTHYSCHRGAYTLTEHCNGTVTEQCNYINNVKQEIRTKILFNSCYQSAPQEYKITGGLLNDKLNGSYKVKVRDAGTKTDMLLYECNFKDGVLEGSVNHYDNSKLTGQFHDGTGVMTMTNTYYYYQESHTETWTVVNTNKIGSLDKYVKQGKYEIRDKENRLILLAEYDNDKLVNEFNHYYKEGTIKLSIRFIDNIIDGPFIIFDIDEKPIFTGYCDKGKKSGTWTINTERYSQCDINLLKFNRLSFQHLLSSDSLADAFTSKITNVLGKKCEFNCYKYEIPFTNGNDENVNKNTRIWYRKNDTKYEDNVYDVIIFPPVIDIFYKSGCGNCTVFYEPMRKKSLKFFKSLSNFFMSQ